MQDGKLIGTVPHVIVQDLTREYGIFADDICEISAESASRKEEVHRMDTYIVHKIKETNEIQTVEEHCQGTARLMQEKCPLEELISIAWLAGFLHDRGKNSDDFQEYILKAIEGTGEVHRGDVNHSSAGGRIIEIMMPGTLVSKMIQTAVYSHHGLRDCLSPKNGSLLFEWSINDKSDIKQAGSGTLQSPWKG